MNYPSSSFVGKESWNENLWQGQQVKISLKIEMIFLSFVTLHVVQKNE